ncbi:hypothetical protein EZV62_003559 [Acer yangbiense]|uniref:Uncharacterized protein n=1 Tax=Acer yangbiense TaxID=1000413 RepID=A0A5C7II18_9ROSI|nr:hypothetical protein EZV62_003559 [Acer yangbiense]
MSEKEVEEYRVQREITVEGRDVPKPVKSFSNVGSWHWTITVVSCCNFLAYDRLTKLLLLRAKSNMLCKKLQKLALNGRDLIGIAETGSGIKDLKEKRDNKDKSRESLIEL